MHNNSRAREKRAARLPDPRLDNIDYKNRRTIKMSRSKVNIPEAKAALDKFKMQAASEVGVTLNQGYNGNITAREAGSVGGQMVNNISPVRLLDRALSLPSHFSVFLPVNILISSLAVLLSSILTMILSMY